MRTVTAPLVYVSVEGEAQGPFTGAELSTLWKAGELDASALYWFRGMPAWEPVERYAAPTSASLAGTKSRVARPIPEPARPS